jgi:hypothetical protein
MLFQNLVRVCSFLCGGARVHHAMGEYDRAIADLDEAIRLSRYAAPSP